MPTSEKIALAIFLVIVILVYCLQIRLIAVFVINKIKGRRPLKKKLFRKLAIVVHVLGIIGVMCFGYGCFIESSWIEVKTIRIETDKLAKTNIRIVQISDLHCEKKRRNEEKIVELINNINADIVVFTGDCLERPNSASLFKNTMNRLNANIGKFAVRGNYDIWHCLVPGLFNDTGFKLLDADTVKLKKNGEIFYISGLSCDNPKANHSLLKKIDDDGFSVFLYHYSDLIEDLQGLNVDLYLCGHTHGGQVALPFYGAVITLSKFGKKYEAGMYAVADTILYVNRGIGMEANLASKVRFLARPEITVFEIVPKK